MDGANIHLTQVLIVGAGPAGLMLGCELARRGIDSLVVEQDAQPPAGSRGKGLQPRTQEIFEDLGILADVQALGGLYPALQVHRDGQVVFEGRMDPLREVTPDVPYPNIWMLPQWRTGEILAARYAELGGHVRYGCELASFRQDSDGVTAVVRGTGSDDGDRNTDGGDADGSSSDGSGGNSSGGNSSGGNSSDGQQEIRAQYLVGADGGRSTVRRALGIEFAGETREQQRMIVADVRAEGVGREFWHVWTGSANGAGDGFMLGLCPLPSTGQFQFTSSVPADAPAPELTIEALQQIADDAGAGQVRLTEVGWTSLWRANMRMAQHFRSGRVFLAGDAAHVHSPAGGQGLNTSVQDVYNLGWKLAAVLTGAPAALLDSYESERLPIAADVLGISTRLHDKAVEQDPDAHKRDDPELRELNLGYRDSALSQEFRAAPGPVLAGDRAPDAPGTDAADMPVRLFTLLHSGATTLLAFGPAAAQIAAGLVADRPGSPLRAVAVVPSAGTIAGAAVGMNADSTGATASTKAGNEVFADPAGTARAAYGVPSDQDVLLAIRPDGYVGFAADADDAAADRAAKYLAQIMADG